MLYGNIIYGSWRDGADIYKDKRGYFIIKWDNKNDKEYKKYLASWKPKPTDSKVYYNPKTKKWQLTKPKN